MTGSPQRPYKVMHLVRGFTDYMVEVVNAQAACLEPHLVLAEKDAYGAAWLHKDVHVFLSRAPRVAHPGNLAALLRTAWYIHAVRPDVLHLQSGVIWELALRRWFRRVPMALTLHDVVNHPSHTRTVLTPQRLIDEAIRLSDAILVHAPRLKEMLLQERRALVGHRPVHVVPMGVMARYGTGRAPDRPRGAHILLFGTIDSWKGVEVLVQAEPLVRKSLPQAKTIIAGWCMNPPYYEKLIRPDQSIERRFTRQTDDQVRELFAWADVLVLPYIEASQSAVLQTGMAFGVPMVVSRVGGLPDVIEDGVNGLVVTPGRADELAQAIVRMLTDIDLRGRIIRRMLEQRETVFNWSHIAERIADVYHGLWAD